MSNLFQPFNLKSLSLNNRVVMAPMTRNFSPGGVPGDAVIQYYARRAAGGVGLIISEGAGVSRDAAVNGPSIPHFHGAKALGAWKQVIDAVHAVGGRMAPQLWHVGAVPSPTGAFPEQALESPSGLVAPGRPIGRVMSDCDISDTIAAFAKAAGDARELGFDAVELHGAHGYLIDQFFWAGANSRSDRYGGPTIFERGRFAADILRAVRETVGRDFPIIIRLSQWKQQDYSARLARTPAELEAWLAPLVDAGADALHCSQRRFWEPEFEGSDLNFAGWAKKVSGVTTITVGSVGLSGAFNGTLQGEGSSPAPLDELLHRLDRGDFDLVAVGRALLQDPLWTAKIRDGRRTELMDFHPSALKTLA